MKAISSSITKIVALIAAMVVAFGTFGLAAAHADGYDTNRIADPDANGTITINPVSGDPVRSDSRSFNGYRLASLKDVKTNSTGTALGSFTVETNSNYTQVIENVMGQITTNASTGKTLKDDYQANAWYSNTSVTPKIDNPMGYIAATYGSVAETTKPWGGDNADGSKDTVMRQFADKLAAALTADATKYPADKTLTIGENTNVPQGLYLITETTKLDNATISAIPMIVSTTYHLKDAHGAETDITTNVGTIDLKATIPTITKQLTNGNTTNAKPDFSIGDEVDYELTATIPSYTGYDIDTTGDNTDEAKAKARVLKIYDEAEPGLTIDSVESVYVDGTKLTEKTDYTVETSTDSDATDSYKDGTKTVINLANYVNMRAGTVSATNHAVAFGGTVKVKIKAKLNSKAKVSDASQQRPNMNKTSLGYSHIPNQVTDEHVQPGGDVNVYTYKFTITKKNRDGKNTKNLPGAQFAIKNADGKYLKWTDATDTDGKNGAWGTVDTTPTAAAQRSDAPTGQDLKDSNAKGIFYSGDGGTVSFNGLKAGTYTIEEIASPSGYLNTHALLPSFTVTITPSYEQDSSTNPYANDALKKASWGDYTIKKPTDNPLTISNSADFQSLHLVTASGEGGNGGNVDVINVTSITQLPKTGAAGIAFFSVIGVAIVALAALFAVRARKASRLA